MLLSPPCSSFSRAAWANFRGPRPVRSYDHPRGLETLTPAERDRAILGNIFADFSFEVATLVADGAASFLALEQIEDLGALASGPHEGLRPASMWQWRFGTPYAKPTRLLLRMPLEMPDCDHEGPPCYDAQGVYTGPLPSAQGYSGMLHRQATEPFKTTGSEQWPANMCQWLSALLLSSCKQPAKDAVGWETAAKPNDPLAQPRKGWLRGTARKRSLQDGRSSPTLEGLARGPGPL